MTDTWKKLREELVEHHMMSGLTPDSAISIMVKVLFPPGGSHIPDDQEMLWREALGRVVDHLHFPHDPTCRGILLIHHCLADLGTDFTINRRAK